MNPQYYDRFDPSKNYDRHLFISGRGLQGAEMNELQLAMQYRLRGVADAMFKDGDVIKNADVLVDSATGATQCQNGAIYVAGCVRGVEPAAFTIPVVGSVAIGVRLVQDIITHVEDPTLVDPATGTRNYQKSGAERLRVVARWAWSGDGGQGEFFSVYTVTDGVLNAKDTPPQYDASAQTLARYDRDSAGGTYIASGLTLRKLPDDGTKQVYSLSEGRARVFGFGVEFTTARRLTLEAVPDLRPITNEPHSSSTVGAQRVNFNRAPGTAPSRVSITAERTVSLTHNVVTGGMDTLPDTSVLAILEVKQGATIFTSGADYNLSQDRVDWSPAGAEPAPGSSYTVKYRYQTLVAPTAVDDKGFTVTGAVVGTSIFVDYAQKLPRYDRLCITQDGAPVWVSGVASSENPLLPVVPSDMLAVASVLQTWTAERAVINNGVRTVPMTQLNEHERRLDYLTLMLAQQQLLSDVHTREAGIKKGIATDPFLDDSLRDAGTPQTAAIVNGVLTLPIAASAKYVSQDVTKPTACTYASVITLEQSLRTGGMKINPYQAFALIPARVTLNPAIDRWTEVQTQWASPVTNRLSSGGAVWGGSAPGGGGSSSSGTWIEEGSSTNALINTTRTQIETLRQIQVSYRVEGFGPGEPLKALTFDGITIAQPGKTANAQGVVMGTFTVPANVLAGSKLVEVESQGGLPGSAIFTGQGTLERQTWQQQTTITSRFIAYPSAPPAQNNGGGVAVFGPTGAGTTSEPKSGNWLYGGYFDPLAQTFTLPAATQLCGVDLWFVTKPTTFATVQIRQTDNGFPTQVVMVSADIKPDAINLGGAHTRVNFAGPQMLQAGVEYAIVVMCNDGDGEVAVAELGQFDAVAQRWVSAQPYTVGVLLSSSNAVTWTAHQDRDMAFRLVAADYAGNTTRTIDLGTVAVTSATDLMVMAFADRPVSQSQVEYLLAMPDGSTLTVADGQAVQLAAAITGDVGVKAKLTGTKDFSPVLFPGTQVVVGTIATAGDYVIRAVLAGSNVSVKVVYEALLPNGSSVTPKWKGIDAGDTWSAGMAITATKPADDGFTEITHSVSSITEASVQIKLDLAGGAAARPYVRNLRVIVV